MKDLPIAALLSPLLFAQGRWVRATIPDLPEAQGVRSGSFGNVKSGSVDSDLSILILGDSAAAGVGVVDQKQALSGQLVHQLAQAMDNKASTRVDWTLIAKKGATTANVLSWVPTLERRVYDVIVVSLGVNDVTGGVTKKQWLKQQKVLVAELTSRFSPIQIILSKVPPMGDFIALPQPLRWCLGLQSDRFNNDAISVWGDHPVCEFLQTPFVPHHSLLADDGFHPGEQGYLLWAKAVAECITII